MLKILNQENLQKYWSCNLQTWHWKSTSQKKQNDTTGAIAMATHLTPVPFCEKPNVPISNLLSATGGLARNRHGSHMVFTLLIRLLGVDGTWLRQKLGISILIKTGPAAKLLSWQQHNIYQKVSKDIETGKRHSLF